MFKFSVYARCLNFWSCRKNCKIRKIMLISKFMMSLSGQQTITIDILPKYYMKKSNHTMKFSQLIE